MASEDLQTYQRRIARLIQGGDTVDTPGCSHLECLADPVRLEVTREIILGWRRIGIENYCRLTAAALKRLGLFLDATRDFTKAHDSSPYAEEFGDDFLAEMAMHRHELVASVAAFERALIRTQQGAGGHLTLQWRYEPYAVLHALLQGGELPSKPGDDIYDIEVGKDIDGFFRVRTKGGGASLS